MARHNDLGILGEQLAVEYLIKKGYVILEKNFRFEKHEIDIIAKDKQVLIVVEVKTRSTSKFGEPQNFVKPKQISRLVNAANAFMLKNNLDEEVRFDIVAIIKTQDSFKINHIENAFYYF
ncbi:YraN family protein [Flavobacteriaceae bacterium]|nr:YraN family protein [Flavobacteriaceae bacterium]